MALLLHCCAEHTLVASLAPSLRRSLHTDTHRTHSNRVSPVVVVLFVVGNYARWKFSSSSVGVVVGFASFASIVVAVVIVSG